MYSGADFYDTDKVFESHKSRRYNPDSPNETLEKPVFMELVGDVKGQHILDLGCGDATSSLGLLNSGCASYFGLEASARMVQLADQNLANTVGRVFHTKIEDWDYSPNRFDLVISRLALHYVPDLSDTFRKVNQTLRPDGRFVFSMVHPVITSCDRSRQGGGQRQEWIVDDYFVQGSRCVYFMGEHVEQFHRTVEDIFIALQDAKFVVAGLRESNPNPENFTDQALYERRRRIPLFIFFSATKR
jgi:SAM-dependent methyltransferase